VKLKILSLLLVKTRIEAAGWGIYRTAVSLARDLSRSVATFASVARSFSCVSQKASGAFFANSIQSGPRIVSSVHRWHPFGVGESAGAKMDHRAPRERRFVAVQKGSTAGDWFWGELP
jgi:hypothetical protein